MAKPGILDRVLAPWREARSGSLESPLVKISSANILERLGIYSDGRVNVTEASALGLPPIFAAVNFLSRSLSSLPLHVYTAGDRGSKKTGGAIGALLNHSANDEMTSVAWRKWFWARVFTAGRGLTYIERNAAGTPINLFPMDPAQTTLSRRDNVTTYTTKNAAGVKVTYAAADVIDIPFLLQADGLTAYGPIQTCRDRIGQMIGANSYGKKVFDKGGLPLVALEGPHESPNGMRNAEKDIAEASAKAYNEQRPAIAVPAGFKLNPIGVDPQKMQMVEFQKFLIDEVARIWQLPPIFLQHLENQTFTNAEQQDLHLVKHLILGWAGALEAELDLKLFGRANGRSKSAKYVSHNVDGLLRGDFATRMEGLAKGIQNALLTPNEARALENRPALPKGDELLIQGATVPLGSQKVAATPPAPAAE